MEILKTKGLSSLLNNDEKFIAWVLLAIIPRGLFHFYLFHWNLGSVIFDMYYLLVLHFSLLFSMETLAKLFFKTKINELHDYYLSFIKYWVLIFPLVPIITIITGSSYRLRIEAFQYIPTFMVDKNFLPLGMVFVIPLILFFLTRHLMRLTDLNFVKAFAIVSIANTISYVLYYQWALNMFYTFLVWYSEKTAMCFYCLFGIVMLQLISFNLVRRNILHPNFLKVGWFMFYMYVFVLAAQMAAYCFRIYGIKI